VQIQGLGSLSPSQPRIQGKNPGERKTERDSAPSKRKENVQLGNNAGGSLNRIALEGSKSPVAEYASGALIIDAGECRHNHDLDHGG
jgi:hypothetical protein